MKTMNSLRRNTEAVWTEIAQEIDGQLVRSEFGKVNIQRSYANWMIKLDITGRTGHLLGGISGTNILRVRCPYLGEDDFQFKISRKSIWSKLRALVIYKQAKTDSPSFDKAFLVRGNQIDRLIELLKPAEIKSLLEKQKGFLFEAKKPSPLEGMPSNVKILQFQTLALPQTIFNAEQIASIFHLHEATLDQLCKIGLASPDAVAYNYL